MWAQVKVLVLVLMLIKMNEAQVISAAAGAGVTLPSGLQRTELDSWDFRWTRPHLLLTTNQTAAAAAAAGRCELLSDGSLRIRRVDVRDAGNYTLEAFDRDGKLKQTKRFVLLVEETGGSSSIISRSVAVCSLLLLLVLLVFIVKMRRRRRRRWRCTTSGQGENVYVVMRGGEVKQQEEVADVYVTCHPAVSTEEDVYV